MDCPSDTRLRLDEFRVAIMLDHDECPLEDSYKECLAALGETLSRHGAHVSFDARPTIDVSTHFDNYLMLLGAAMTHSFTEPRNEAELARVRAMGDARVSRIWEQRVAGRRISHGDWQALDNDRRINRRAFDDFFQTWDILLTPVGAGSAFSHDQAGQRFERYIAVNGADQSEILQSFWAGYSGVVGLPSVVGPAGFVGHLPMGYQAISGFGHDRTALAFAMAMERELGNPVGLPVIAR